MDQKTAFPPFALVPASAGPNPFLAAPIELAASVQATDAVWSHDAGDEEDPEAPRAEAVDVRILWGTNVLHFEQMSPPRPFTLGGAGADFTLPELGFHLICVPAQAGHLAGAMGDQINKGDHKGRPYAQRFKSGDFHRVFVVSGMASELAGFCAFCSKSGFVPFTVSVFLSLLITSCRDKLTGASG